MQDRFDNFVLFVDFKFAGDFDLIENDMELLEEIHESLLLMIEVPFDAHRRFYYFIIKNNLKYLIQSPSNLLLDWLLVI